MLCLRKSPVAECVVRYFEQVELSACTMNEESAVICWLIHCCWQEYVAGKVTLLAGRFDGEGDGAGWVMM